MAAGSTRSATKMSRIGVLVIGNAEVPLFGSELREGLREFGLIEGQHYLIEFRSADGQLGRLPELASELVRLSLMSSLPFSCLVP
jgi:hypothetical protein